MKPEDMNTINANKKAFNGNVGALYVAALFAAGIFLIAVCAALKEIFL